MAGRLSDRCAIVTGGASGIGRAVALALAGEGAALAIVDKDAERAQATCADVSRLGVRATAIVHDVREPEDVERALAEVTASLGNVDILVNNAGIGLQRDVLDTSLDEWREMIAVHMTPCFAWSKAVAPAMRERGRGRIVNMVSHAGLLGSTGRGAYSAAKGGMIALTRVMAVEWAEFGITVNAVAPGAIATPMTARNHTPHRTAAWMDALPVQRYGTPEEVAAAVRYLCSDDAAYVTGQVLSVDGGFSARGLLTGTRRGRSEGPS